MKHLLMPLPNRGCRTMHCLVIILNLFLFLPMTTIIFMMCHILPKLQRKVTPRGKMLAINLVYLPPMTQYQAYKSDYQKQEHLGCLE